MPKLQGLSKAEANYRKAEHRITSADIPLGEGTLPRGVIHAEDVCDEFKPRGGAGSART